MGFSLYVSSECFYSMDEMFHSEVLVVRVKKRGDGRRFSLTSRTVIRHRVTELYLRSADVAVPHSLFLILSCLFILQPLHLIYLQSGSTLFCGAPDVLAIIP